jgi:hypothetical protein
MFDLKDSSRYDRWRMLSAEDIKGLPIEDQKYILAAVEEHGKQHLKKQRQAKFNSIKKGRLPEDKENLSIFIVTFCGALTFSIAPHLLGSQAGRGAWAISAGIIGGGAASYFAHTNASRVLTGLKLKNSTKQAYQSINEQQIKVRG